MADEYIKREDATNCALGVVAVISCGVSEDDAHRIIGAFRSVPSADVQPVRHGRWVDTEPNKRDWDYRKNGMAYYCSCCLHRAGKEKHKTYKYCPWCGAKMDGDIG